MASTKVARAWVRAAGVGVVAARPGAGGWHTSGAASPAAPRIVEQPRHAAALAVAQPDPRALRAGCELAGVVEVVVPGLPERVQHLVRVDRFHHVRREPHLLEQGHQVRDAEHAVAVEVAHACRALGGVGQFLEEDVGVTLIDIAVTVQVAGEAGEELKRARRQVLRPELMRRFTGEQELAAGIAIGRACRAEYSI